MTTDWVPGSPLQLASGRVRLRTLVESDCALLESGSADWYGSEKRREYVWTPPVGTIDYFRGLIRACDQKRRFACLIRDIENHPVGFFKAQIASGGAIERLIPTVVIGDESNAGQGLGTEATGLFIWFGIHHLGVTEVCIKCYAENNATAHIVKKSGYELIGEEAEKQPNGTTKRVLVFAIQKDAWLARTAPARVSFRVETFMTTL